MRDEPHAQLRHPDHPSSTVIHKYENEPILRRWFRRGIEKGPRFWILWGGVLVLAAVVMVLVNFLFVNESTSSQAWMDWTLARSTEQQEKLAKTYPESPAARWALLEAAGSEYNQGFYVLTTDRDKASTHLKKAYGLFAQADKEALKSDPAVARLAELGMARTLEASIGLARTPEAGNDDRKRAIAQYEHVASTWPDSQEGKRAALLAKALQERKNIEFYEWLTTYEPPKISLPPAGRSNFDLVPPPFEPETPGSTSGAGVSAGSVPGGELPTNVFENQTPATGAGGRATAPPPSPEPAPSERAPEPTAPTPKSERSKN